MTEHPRLPSDPWIERQSQLRLSTRINKSRKRRRRLSDKMRPKMGATLITQRALLAMASVLASLSSIVILGLPAPSVALAAVESPVIESESATAVTSMDATLNAKINTNSLYTTYEFEIGTNSSYNYTQMACPLPLPGYEQCMTITDGPTPPVKEPDPEHILAGSGVQTVSLDLASIRVSLQPDTTYYYRVIAANTSNGQTVEGLDQTFTTAAVAGPVAPVIESKPTTGATSTEATSPGRSVRSSGSRSKKNVRTHRRKKPKKRDKKAKRQNERGSRRRGPSC